MGIMRGLGGGGKNAKTFKNSDVPAIFEEVTCHTSFFGQQ